MAHRKSWRCAIFLAGRIVVGLVFLTTLKATPSLAVPILYDLVTVGNAGNTGQTQTYENGGTLTFGAVPYSFQIGKYPVTIGQYTAFLNAVAASDPYGLYQPAMGTNDIIYGIDRTGLPGSYSYTVAGPEGSNPGGAQTAANRPISWVSWWDAARFANWMANGQPTGPAGATTTENGAYNVNGATTGTVPGKNTVNPNTNAPPTFYIPSENEWYKAAYYSPDKGGSGSPGYFVYGTQSDIAPGNGWNGTTALADKDIANQANYRVSNRYAVTGTTANPGQTGGQNLLTDVGAFASSYSYYQAFDMTGNVWEWNDLDALPGTTRSLRGGDFGSNSASSASSWRTEPGAQFDTWYYGFRLASPVIVPEPAGLSFALAGLGGALSGWLGMRRRRAGIR